MQRTSGYNVQTFSVGNSHTEYQGETLAADKVGTGIQKLWFCIQQTCLRCDALQINFNCVLYLNIFGYLWKICCLSNALNLFGFRLVYLTTDNVALLWVTAKAAPY